MINQIVFVAHRFLQTSTPVVFTMAAVLGLQPREVTVQPLSQGVHPEVTVCC